MNINKTILLLIGLSASLLQGCIAFPPLIQVQHKDAPQPQQEVLQRLDAIDHRLEKLEQHAENK